MDWQPIETAPRDGSWVLVYRTGHAPEDAIRTACWCEYLPGESFWQDHDDQNRPEDDTVTHWMPLPLPPTVNA